MCVRAGFSAMCVSVALVALGHYVGLFNVDYIYHNMIPLISSAILFSYALSIYLYLSSFGKGKRLAAGGNTGNLIYDFFIGRELNPRIGSFDLKEFCELRPGLVGWAVINFSMAYHQYATYGVVSASMILVLIFQTIYVVDGLYNEVCSSSNADSRSSAHVCPDLSLSLSLSLSTPSVEGHLDHHGHHYRWLRPHVGLR